MPASRLPISARLLRLCLQWPRIRGTTRLSRLLVRRMMALHEVPLQVASGQTLYLDMRDQVSREMLCAGPREGDPYWEPDEQQVMRRVVRRGDAAFDVGAHFGEHAVLLTQLVGHTGRVYAFEPNPARLPGLRRTLARDGNGTVMPYAVSDRSGRATLFVPETHACAGLADWTHGEFGRVRQVACQQVTLDDLIHAGVARRPDFVKCDVEGAELKVFKGASDMLNRPDAPIVMYEANRWGAAAYGLAISAATDFLTSLPEPRFSFYLVRPSAALVPVRDVWPDAGLFNLVAVPASKVDRIR